MVPRSDTDPGSAWLQPAPHYFMVKNLQCIGEGKQRLMGLYGSTSHLP